MEMKHRVLAAAIMTTTLGLTGCAGVGWSAKASCNGGGCSVEGEIHGGTQQKLMAGGNDGSSMLSARTGTTSADLAAVDANSVMIDTSGSTVTIPTFGNITLKLVDSTSGFVFAARTFGWNKVGGDIKFSDPYSVNAWIQDNGSGADDLQYALAPFAVAEAVGLNTFATAVTYAGEVQAASTYTWTGSGGGACNLCQVK